MRHSSRREEQISRPKSLPAFAANIFTAAAGNEINLIARVWLLWIVVPGRIDFHGQTSVLKDGGESFTVRSGEFRECVSYAQQLASVHWFVPVQCQGSLAEASSFSLRRSSLISSCSFAASTEIFAGLNFLRFIQ